MLKHPSYTLLQAIAFSLWMFYVVGIFFAVPSCFFTHFVGLCCCGMLGNAGWHFDTDCQPALCNIPEVWRPQPHCDRSLKSPNGNRKQIVSHGWLVVVVIVVVVVVVVVVVIVIHCHLPHYLLHNSFVGYQWSIGLTLSLLLKPCRLCGTY